jgi:hypothetical protein
MKLTQFGEGAIAYVLHFADLVVLEVHLQQFGEVQVEKIETFQEVLAEVDDLEGRHHDFLKVFQNFERVVHDRKVLQIFQVEIPELELLELVFLQCHGLQTVEFAQYLETFNTVTVSDVQFLQVRQLGLVPVLQVKGTDTAHRQLLDGWQFC